MSRPRILFIAPACPSPAGNGLAIRANLFLTAYAQVADIDLAVVPVAGPALIDPRTAALCRRSTIIEVDGVDSHFALVQAVADNPARLAAFARYGAPAVTAFLTRGVVDRLAAFAARESYALVHVSRTYMGDLAAPWRGVAGTRTVIDCDEVDSEVLTGIARLERQAGYAEAAAWARIDARHLDRHARGVLPGFDLCFAASQPEAAELAAMRTGRDVHVLANPAPSGRAIRLPPARGERVILLVGTMNYGPNVEGAVWFARQILPWIQRRARTGVRLVIAGHRPAARVRRLGALRGVTVAGTVPDLRPLYGIADIVVAPLRAGGGTRIKILEAARMGRACVSTRVGARGLDVRHGRDIWLADDRVDFGRACLRLLRHPELAGRLASNAARTLLPLHNPARLRNRILRSTGLGGGHEA